MRLDGYGLFVKDMATMIRFYRDVLGFKIKEDENTIIYKNYCSCYIKIQKQDNQYSVEINGYQLQKYYSNINDAKEAAYSSISSERISEWLNEQKNLLKAALEQGVNEKKWIC